jgi:hypothetical protein
MPAHAGIHGFFLAVLSKAMDSGARPRHDDEGGRWPPLLLLILDRR